jgi:hypothetical protein
LINKDKAGYSYLRISGGRPGRPRVKQELRAGLLSKNLMAA